MGQIISINKECYMNKKLVFLSTTLTLFLVAFLCNLDTRRLLTGCYWQKCAPERNFHVLDWEIPAHLFSDSTQISHIYISSEGMGEIERGSQSMFWDGGDGIAGYDIYRYSTIKKASVQYERILKHMVNDRTESPWIRPNELSFHSVAADELFVTCGDWTKKRCGMLARYQEYVIFFNTIMDDEMTYSEFEKIAFYLDEQISSRLYP